MDDNLRRKKKREKNTMKTGRRKTKAGIGISESTE